MALTQATAGVLADGAVTTAKIADDAVTTAKIADNAITNALMADDAVGVAELSATGTASATTFLRGDNAWAAPAPDLTLVDEQATTSGTSIDFTSIPASVKRITVLLNGVSVSGTSDLLVQIGDAGGLETTGYASSSAAAGGNTDSTIGFILTQTSSATAVWSGSISLNLQKTSTFTWVSAGILASPGFIIRTSAGGKALTAELDQLRLTTVNGTDTFDAGSVSISYE